MKCVIGGAHLRVFGRAIHAIARISDEFWFDPLEKGVPSHLSPSTFNMDERHIICNCNYADCIMEEPFPLCSYCSILCYLSLSRTSGLIPRVKRFLCCTPSEAASKRHVLYQDDSTGRLALRSVNSSRSAYAYVFFSSMFFQHYCWAAVPQPHQKEKQLSPPCKLIIKSVLPVFRCVNMLERNVEKCSIYTSINDHHVTFQLLCKHGVVKTYNLTFQECDPLQAVFAKHMCPNVLKLHSRLLADIMVHFPTSQEEVTLSVTPMKVCFRSYTEEDTDFSKTMLTEIQLNPDEFDYFQVGVDSEVTFCLKELRGLLAFSEATSVPVSIHFDISGKPVAFSIEDLVLEASFILATLSDVDKKTSQHQPPSFTPRQESPETRTGKAEKASMDKDSSTQANASKKPQRSGNTSSTESAKPGSPLVKQRKVIPGATGGDATGVGGTTTAHAALAGAAAEAHYDKFPVRRRMPSVTPSIA
ncbi:cell cycle checkpoint control protein RAD9B isoform X3 [Lathamus discolor]|uniref:cell cycle checkpoint control protein RAD9B isoform X3 n=1 Tax=Lathamus discolor TaxID=678569 RepID=UPI0032B7013A